jgi:hypothetical protein
MALLVGYQYHIDAGDRKNEHRASRAGGKMKTSRTCASLMSGLALVTVLATSALSEDDRDSLAVRQLLMQTYDKPEAHLVVDPIVVENDVAIADWSQGEIGGRALLHRKEGKWIIALCAGDALTQSGALERLGLAKPAAEALAARLAAAERGVAPSILERFSRFDGIVAVDATGGHSPLDPYHQPIP